MDWNEVYAQIQPAIDWIVSTGAGGFIAYFVARFMANKWFKKNDVNNLLTGFTERLTGSAIDIDFTAVANDKLEAIQKSLSGLYEKKLDEQSKQLKQITQVLADLADVHVNSKMLSDEHKAKIAADVAKIREDAPAPAKQTTKIVLKPLKTETKSDAAPGKDYIKAG